MTDIAPPWTPVEDLAVVANRPISELAELLGRTPRAVEKRRMRLWKIEPYHVRMGLCPTCGATPPMWTPERIAKSIRDWAESHDGRPPTSYDWQLADYDHPVADTVIRVFGTFEGAVRAAGLAPVSRKLWNRARILTAIQAWATAHGGEPPRQIDWAQSAPEHPSHMSVVKEFGTWNRAIDEAGYFPRAGSGGRYRYANHERTRRVA